MFCKYCGAKFDDDSVFCSSCGKRVSTTDKPVSDSPKNFALTIFRESQTFLLNPPINVVIDGSKRLSIANGEDVVLTLPEGEHSREFSQSVRHKELNITLDRDMQIIVKWNRITGSIIADVE